MLEQKLLNKLFGIFEWLTGYIASISSDHAYIHKGISFSIAKDLGSLSAAYSIAINTPSTASGKYVHYRPGSVGVTSNADSVKYELIGPITSYTGGTPYTPFNRNSLSSNVSACTVMLGVTPTVGAGIVKDFAYVGSTGNPTSKSGGSAGGDDELVLEADAIYILRITPAGATNVGLTSLWYEEDAGLSEA